MLIWTSTATTSCCEVASQIFGTRSGSWTLALHRSASQVCDAYPAQCMLHCIPFCPRLHARCSCAYAYMPLWCRAAGILSKDKLICPQGCTLAYASPQHLRAMQCQLEWDDCGSALAASGDSHSSHQRQRASSPAKSRRLLSKLSSLWQRAMCCRGVLDSKLVNDSVMDGRASDVYSAGVVLYELVRNPCSRTGVKPVITDVQLTS